MEKSRIRRLAIPTAALLLAAVMVLVLFKGDEATVSPVTPLAAKTFSPLNSAEVVTPIPPPPPLNHLRIALGERLFKEVRLSADNSVACSSCHDLERGGVDRKKVSSGIGGAQGDINAPTVFNSGLNFVQFWNGRAATLEEQAAGPIHNPLEMASDWARILPRLKADDDYLSAFAGAYRDGITADNVLNAIATFERSLLTPNSPFDQHLRGEIKLSEAAQAGYRRFRELGCAACHQGVLLGGNMYQKFGVLRNYYEGKTPSKADLGRYNVSGRTEDRHVFKVPSLRNIALTAPYFHDASAATLEQAVLVMGRYQLGREISPQDIGLIVAFLNTLTGQWQGKPLQ